MAYTQIDVDLAEKPEVLAIIDESGCTPDQAAGRIVLFWLWVDRQFLCERIEGPSIKSLCRMFGGDEAFWRAVERQKWVKFGDGWIEVPEWEKRFTQSSKRRLADAKRKAVVRSESEPCPPPSGHNADIVRTDCGRIADLQSESESEYCLTDFNLKGQSRDTREAAKQTDPTDLQEPDRAEWDQQTSWLNGEIPKSSRDRRFLGQVGWLLAAHAPIRSAVIDSIGAVRSKHPPPKNPIGYFHTVLREKIPGWNQYMARAPPATACRIPQTPPYKPPNILRRSDDPDHEGGD